MPVSLNQVSPLVKKPNKSTSALIHSYLLRLIITSLAILISAFPVRSQTQQAEETRIEPLPALAPLVAGAELPRLAVYDIFEQRFDSAEQLHWRWVIVGFVQTDDSLSLKQLPSLCQLSKDFPGQIALVLVEAGDSSVESLKRFRLMQKLEDAVILQDHYQLITHEFSVESQIPAIVLADTLGIIQFVQYGSIGKGDIYTALKKILTAKP
jgi:hypothetical protein